MIAFSITWDYRCPFARNANEHVLAALDAGADWDVEFIPFSLGQVHVEHGGIPIWDRPSDDSGLLALQVGTVVRDTAEPAVFRAVHRDLFALRHDDALDLRDRDAISAVLTRHGVDAVAVFDEIDEGLPLKKVRAEHEAAAVDYDVWGVPTFIAGGHAAFVRIMDRPGTDGDHARRSIQRVLDLLTDAPDLNEFKHTSLSR